MIAIYPVVLRAQSSYRNVTGVASLPSLSQTYYTENYSLLI